MLFRVHPFTWILQFSKNCYLISGIHHHILKLWHVSQYCLESVSKFDQINNRNNLDFNNNKINEAKSEGELWRIANDVIKPKEQAVIFYI